MDVIDISTGGGHSKQKIKGGPAFQAPFSEAVKKAHGDKIIVTAVGTITDGHIAQSILDKVKLFLVIFIRVILIWLRIRIVGTS